MAKTEKQVKKRLPLRMTKRFIVPEDTGKKPYLVASRCKNCGKYFFPPMVVCLNCGKLEMEPAALNGKGEIYTFTVVWQQIPNAVVKVPYSIVNVVMEEGCSVEGVVTENPETLKIGDNVEVYFEKVREDKDGNDLYADKFRLVNEQ